MAFLVDRQVQLFSDFTDDVRKTVIKRFAASYSPSDLAYIRTLTDTDFVRILLSDMKMASAIDGLIVDYQKILDANPAIIARNLPPGTLDIIKTLDEQFWYEHVRDVGEEIKRSLLQASIGGVNESTIIARLTAATESLSGAQVGTLVNTTLRTASRTVFAAGANELPDNTLVEYVGPYDNRKRDYCAGLLGQVMTIDEAKRLVNDQGGSTWTDGGGFNCRDRFIIVEKKDEESS